MQPVRSAPPVALRSPDTLDTMADITVISEEEPEEPSGDVLAEAAVASAAIAGHASAQADRAVEWSGELAEELDEVEAVATHAAIESAGKPSREEVRQIADEAAESALERLAALLSERLAPTMTEPAAEPKKDEAPESVKKSKKKKTFAERYLGIGDDEE